MRLFRFFCLLLLAALSMPLLAQDFTPYIAKVTGDSVRIRGGASLAHPPVCVMKDGDELTVLAEKDGWATVRLPADAPCWISADFVKASADGKSWTVTGDKVNLRVSPDTNYFPVGQAEKESTLTAVFDGQTGAAAVKDGYVQVVPPAAAHGAIALEFLTKVKNVAPEKAVEQPAPRPDEAPKAEEKPADTEVKREPTQAEIDDERQTFKELVTMLEDEIKKPAADVNLTGIRKMFEQFKEFSLEKATSEEAGRYIEKIDLTVKIIADEKARIAKAEADRKAEIERLANEAKDKPVVEEPKGPVEYLSTGTVGATGKTAKTPASHRLFDDEGKVLYDLRWDKGDLSKLMGSKVGITGTIKEYDGWPNKVIVIDRIDVIEEEEEK